VNLLYPKFPLNRWPVMLGIAGLGAVIAGLYGIVHDQITYTISPVYFTRLKFKQFHYADFGLPLRVFVGEIGFLATWWVGLVAGWVLARVTAPHAEPRRVLALSLRGFAIIIGFAVAGAAITFAYDVLRTPDPESSRFAKFAHRIGVNDIPAFTRVACIHNASYLAGFLGVITAGILSSRKVRSV